MNYITPEDARRDIQEIGRFWLGTPYRHQAKLRGVGVDCVGLCIGIGLDSGYLSPIGPDEWQPYARYSRTPNPAKMTEALNLFMRPVTDTARAGDWAFIEWRTGQGRTLPMHLAMLCDGPDGPTILHAYEDHGAVVEHGFTSGWPEQVVSWWRYPILAAIVEEAGGYR